MVFKLDKNSNNTTIENVSELLYKSPKRPVSFKNQKIKQKSRLRKIFIIKLEDIKDLTLFPSWKKSLKTMSFNPINVNGKTKCIRFVE